jgi:hypothetical protein
MFTLDKQTVIGTLKARGSKDFDVLYAHKNSMLAKSRALRTCGLVASESRSPRLAGGFATRATRTSKSRRKHSTNTWNRSE